MTKEKANEIYDLLDTSSIEGLCSLLEDAKNELGDSEELYFVKSAVRSGENTLMLAREYILIAKEKLAKVMSGEVEE